MSCIFFNLSTQKKKHLETVLTNGKFRLNLSYLHLIKRNHAFVICAVVQQ